MKKRTLFITAAIVVLALAAPLVYAAGRMHRNADGPFSAGMFFGHFGRIQKELDLSDQQVSELRIIAQQLHDQNAPYRQQARSGFLSIAQTLVNNPNDVTAAQAQLDKQQENERVMKQNMLAAAAKALTVLTPEQRAKVSDMLAKRAARMNG